MGLKLSLQYLEIPGFQLLSPESSSINDTLCYSVSQNSCPVVVTLRLGKAGVADENQCNGGCSGGYWKLGISLMFLVAGIDNKVGSVPKRVQKDYPHNGLNSAGGA